MPTSTATDDSGFTLVELMVVLFIIGLASTAVMLVARPSGGSANSEAERLAARIAAARDHAVLQSRGMRIWIRASGYGFSARSDGEWQAMTQAPFSPVTWDGGTTARIANARQMEIVFDSTGLPSSAADIQVINDDRAATVRLSAAGDVDVTR